MSGNGNQGTEPLVCCGHRRDRHMEIVEGNPRFTICLTGFCRCGKPKIKKRELKAYISPTERKKRKPFERMCSIAKD